MKMTVVLLATCLLALAGCGAPTAKRDHSAPKVEDAPQVALEDLAVSKDPYCRMSLEGHSIAAVATHEGKQYGFCSTYCRDEFVKDPETYLAKIDEPPSM